MPDNSERPFTSDRLRLLAPMITPEAHTLALARIMNPKERLVREKRAMDHPENTIKVALLLVRFMNPDEDLTNEEEAVLRGMSAGTVGKMKARNEL